VTDMVLFPFGSGLKSDTRGQIWSGGVPPDTLNPRVRGFRTFRHDFDPEGPS